MSPYLQDDNTPEHEVIPFNEEVVLPVANYELYSKIVNMHRHRVPIQQISMTLDVTPAFVAKAIKHMQDEWKEQYLVDLTEHVLADVDLLEYAIGKTMPAVEAGNLKAINTMTAVLERKAKLLGYDRQGAVAPDQSSELVAKIITDMAKTITKQDAEAMYRKVIDIEVSDG